MLPTFTLWLHDKVSSEKADGVDVDSTVDALSSLPSQIAMRYRSMSSYGYHYRVRSSEEHMKTMDSGIAATFLRECRFGLRDRNPVIAPVEYVGHLEEIIELDYATFRPVVLIGTWVKANYRGATATVKKDSLGFTIANFAQTIPFGRDSFAFPLQVEQVFFCECAEAPGWKVVVQTEPRGKRVVASPEDIEGGLLFHHGRDNEFPGLRVPDALSEEPVPPPPGGRYIRLSDTLDADTQETLVIFDADLGASSEGD